MKQTRIAWWCYVFVKKLSVLQVNKGENLPLITIDLVEVKDLQKNYPTF